jgi:hypothetical protein
MDLSSLFDDSFGVVATVKDFGADFALSFGFGTVFDAGFGNFDGSVIVQFDNSFLGKKTMSKYSFLKGLSIIWIVYQLARRIVAQQRLQ